MMRMKRTIMAKHRNQKNHRSRQYVPRREKTINHIESQKMSNTSNADELFEPEIILKKISIKNFRGFVDVSIHLDPKLNIVIGENGSGKTALIEGIAKMSSLLVQHFRRQQISTKNIFSLYDVRHKSQNTYLHTHFRSGEKQMRLKVEFNNQNYKTPKENTYGINKFRSQLTDWYFNNRPVNLPLFAYYPAENVPLDFNNIETPIEDSNEIDMFTCYNSVLGNKHFDFSAFFEWYKWQENIEKQIGKNITLSFVRETIYSILSNDDVRFDKLSINWLNDPNGELIINKNETPLNINQLSSGEKLLLILVSDLSRRMFIANPHRKNPLDGYGIVLIDEVDLHLHPRWQRAILPQFVKTFPNLQFIATTHSPLVLSKAKPHQIIAMHNFEKLNEISNTYGRDPNSILSELMGVSRRPEEVQNRIDDIFTMIDKKDFEKAKQSLQELSKDLGEHDDEILKAYTHLNFMEEA